MVFGSGERTRLACWRMRPRIRELCRFHFFKSAAILSESQLQRLALPPSAFLLSFPRSFQILHDLTLLRCPRSLAPPPRHLPSRSLIQFARFGRDDFGVGYVRNHHEVTIQRFNDSTLCVRAVSAQNEMNFGFTPLRTADTTAVFVLPNS
jgi:hypothetical protein